MSITPEGTRVKLTLAQLAVVFAAATASASLVVGVVAVIESTAEKVQQLEQSLARIEQDLHVLDKRTEALVTAMERHNETSHE